MANTITLATKMTDALDKAVVQKSVTGIFTDNSLGAKFVGAKTVSIPDMAMEGLADYDRAGGFVGGDLSVTRSTYTLTMDRGRSFSVDAQDNDESGVANLAGQVMGEFVRTQVVPEMDAYVLSKLAALASTKSHTVSVGADSTLAADAFNMFQTALMEVQAATGYSDDELVAFINPTFWAALNASSVFTRQIVVGDFKKGEIDTHVKKLDGCALIPTDGGRMKSAYDFKDGTTEGQTTGGFTPTTGAKNVGFIIMPKKAASLVKKTEKIRVFDPSKNLNADAWKLDYRIYYDLFVMKSREDQIYAYIEA